MGASNRKVNTETLMEKNPTLLTETKTRPDLGGSGQDFDALLKKVPNLFTDTKIRWKLEGSGPYLESLCELLKKNAIPTIELNMSCKKRSEGVKNEEQMMFNR